MATLDFTYHPLTSRKYKLDGLSKIQTTKKTQESVESDSDDSDSSYEVGSDSDNDDDDIHNMHGVVYNDCIEINYSESQEEYFGQVLFYTNPKIAKQLLVGATKPHLSLSDDNISRVKKKS